MNRNNKPVELKPLFLERMKKLLPDEKDFEKFLEEIKIQPVNAIRCNKLKISSEKLKKTLEEKYNWKISIPWKAHPEIMIIESELLPGELGRSLEHLLGYYYIQELSSMLPVIALAPEKNKRVLDLCAAPGSKTTQISSEMQNTGILIAN
ncbi:16S rRNA (cytosine(1407)-C(5))-methyltransferase RsmF, partial [Candidatus Pacearchaeota archaeon]|nr:16S rRNA (cytosine(1407)-C(5))-methyltransferase RsmF [Candidatus Pacearchaeota archaeon]